MLVGLENLHLSFSIPPGFLAAGSANGRGEPSSYMHHPAQNVVHKRLLFGPYCISSQEKSVHNFQSLPNNRKRLIDKHWHLLIRDASIKLGVCGTVEKSRGRGRLGTKVGKEATGVWQLGR